MTQPNLKIKYWGVRGSVPSPISDEQVLEKCVSLVMRLAKDGGTEKLFGSPIDEQQVLNYLKSLSPALRGTYGGDTSCVEIQAANSPLIIFDAGTGIRHFGKALFSRMFGKQNINPLSSNADHARDLHLFFSHYHWDHLQGFPFFGPGFVSGPMKVNISFYGKRNTQQRLSEVLEGQQQCPNFPVDWEDMPCGKTFFELGRLEMEKVQLGDALVTYCELTHPDAVFAYAVEVNGKKFVYATDTEHKDSVDPRLVRLCKGANILYYDSQYTPEEYIGTPNTLTGPLTKFDWGHSTYEWAVKTALTAGIQEVVLGHHEPLRDDFLLDDLLSRACTFKENMLKLPEFRGGELKVSLAHQGMEQVL